MRTYRQLALTATALGLSVSIAHAQANLSIDPATLTVSSGTTFSVDVDIANVTNLYSYQFDVAFAPTVLAAISSSEGSFLATGGATFFIAGTNDNVGGTVGGTTDTLLSAVNGVNGSGTLAVLTFDAVGTGKSALTIENVELLDSNINPISSTSTGGIVTVTGSTVKAPELDPASAVSGLTLLLGGLAVARGRRDGTKRA